MGEVGPAATVVCEVSSFQPEDTSEFAPGLGVLLNRDAGQLTFLDVAGLLAAASGTTWGAKSLRPFSRQELDFRLDSSYDHWLLDEFQDTSRLQWQALRTLSMR